MSLGIGEMILLAVIALVVIGPEKFPEFAKIVLRTINDLRGYMDDVKHDLSSELRPVKRDLDKAMQPDPVEIPYGRPRRAEPRTETGGEGAASEEARVEKAGDPEASIDETPLRSPPASDGYDD